ncbi:MAG: helix-turn-helix transcriptional regulator [Clostridia bacterium]|nr:helix-turn-helix transcriptional regulator [Clostridia bacterium]
MVKIELFKKEQTIIDGVKYLNENYVKPDLKIGDASSKCFISEAYFRKIFNELYDTSPIKYVNNLRLKKAGELLKNTNCQVKKVFIKCGYVNPCRFSREFKKHYGISPSEYKKQYSVEM